LRSRGNRDGGRGNRNGRGCRRRGWMRRYGSLPVTGAGCPRRAGTGRNRGVAHLRRGLGAKRAESRLQCRGGHPSRMRRRLERSNDRPGDEIGHGADGKSPQRSAPCWEKEHRKPDPRGGEPDGKCWCDLGDWRSHVHAPRAARQGSSHSSAQVMPFPGREKAAASFRRVTNGFLLRTSLVVVFARGLG